MGGADGGTAAAGGTPLDSSTVTRTIRIWGRNLRVALGLAEVAVDNVGPGESALRLHGDVLATTRGVELRAPVGLLDGLDDRLAWARCDIIWVVHVAFVPRERRRRLLLVSGRRPRRPQNSGAAHPGSACARVELRSNMASTEQLGACG